MSRIVACLTYLFLYAPIIVLITYSFNVKGFPSPWDGFTFKWYVELYHETDLWVSFRTSLIVALSTTSLSLSMGGVLVYFRASGAKIGPYLPLFYGNLIVPETVLAISLLMFFSLFHIPLGYTSLIIAHTILGLGFVVPVLYMRYLSIDKRLEESSTALGASPWQTFYKITLPLLRPAMIASGLLVFILSFDDFITAFFCAGTKIQTIPLYLLSMIRIGISPIVNALSAVLLTLSSLLVLLFFSTKQRFSA
ncbi:MAG: Inner membrane ABC transporter permease protein YdcV [Chlamydiia bacterium]|nr:Inner membrane ABC transporter permease protein YdcV [Chlamydiia bacterium]MCH9615869.1 Inner membrane ABC transporter permease protein YdcV [Chlamydiia bacterium]MCH9628728.1 Inner membrane ABC transporter permease protein YdcV [Chlamydiia bacterium]